MDQDLIKLIKKAGKGEKQAFGEIYNMFYKRIYRFVYHLTSDEETAFDLTQNTFLKSWRRIDSFNTMGGSFQAYLFTIARNEVIDFYRKKKELRLSPKIEELIESKQNIEEEMVSNEAKQEVKKALKKLEDIDKQIIILRYFEELSLSEVAKIVNKNEGAIRVRIHRILNKLREILKEENYGN